VFDLRARARVQVKATGYPVLYVDHERVSDEEAFLTVKQERFFSLSPGGSGTLPRKLGGLQTLTDVNWGGGG
jgi:hypothetical protein